MPAVVVPATRAPKYTNNMKLGVTSAARRWSRTISSKRYRYCSLVAKIAVHRLVPCPVPQMLTCPLTRPAHERPQPSAQQSQQWLRVAAHQHTHAPRLLLLPAHQWTCHPRRCPLLTLMTSRSCPCRCPPRCHQQPQTVAVTSQPGAARLCCGQQRSAACCSQLRGQMHNNTRIDTSTSSGQATRGHTLTIAVTVNVLPAVRAFAHS